MTNDIAGDDHPSFGLELDIPDQPHEYLAQMARFSNGATHAVRRAAAVAALPPVAGLEAAALERTARDLPDRVDAVPLAQRVPVQVLGDALGVGDVSEAIGLLCDGGSVDGWLPDVARTSLLFQCRDATAALVLTYLAHGVSVEDAVPVERTRRVYRGEVVWVPLAQAPYGAGAHACVGAEHAAALARGVISALAGYVVVEQGPDARRPNMTLPTRLVMEKR